MSKNHRVIIVAAVLLAVLLIGFLPSNSAFFIVLKLLIAFVVSGGVFFLVFSTNLGLSDTALAEEEDPAVEESLPSAQPKPTASGGIKPEKTVESYFAEFLETIFPLIKHTTVSKTVVLLMVNFFKEKFYLRQILSDETPLPAEDTFFDLTQGLPALVVKHRDPLLENNLPDSEGLIPYHGETVNPPRSFMGVPIFFEDYIVGVLCADADTPQAFSEDDLEILKSFAAVISIQLACSNKLYDYESENWTTKLLYDFSKGILEINTPRQLWSYVSVSLKSVFRADRIIFAERVDDTTGALLYLSEHNGSLVPGSQFLTQEGILGWVLRKNESILIDDFSKKDNYIPRIYPEEEPAWEYKSLLAVPVAIDHQAQVVISVESRRARQFNEQHKKILETMAYQVAAYLDRARSVSQLERFNLVDPATELLNERALRADLDKEVNRASQFKKNFCLQLLKIGTSKNELDPTTYARLEQEFLKFSIPLFGKTNSIYKFEDELYAILWPEQVLREVFTQFQEIYRKIAQRKPWVGGLIEKIYVNCGVVEYPQMGQTQSELIENARKALRKAQERGPNTMEVYEEVNTPGGS